MSDDWNCPLCEQSIERDSSKPPPCYFHTCNSNKQRNGNERGACRDLDRARKMLRQKYSDWRRPYEPVSVKLIIVAESPPANGNYFYKPKQKGSHGGELLFTAFMKHLNFSSDQKDVELRELKRCGWILVDATYEPVDKKCDLYKNDIMEQDFELLCDELKKVRSNDQTPIILIKKNVCETLVPKFKLTRDKFNVVNCRSRDPVVPFPMGRNPFHESFRKMRNLGGIFLPGES